MKNTIYIDFVRTEFKRYDFQSVAGRTWETEIARLGLPSNSTAFFANVTYVHSDKMNPSVTDTISDIVDRCFNPDKDVKTVVRRDPHVEEHPELALWFRITVSVGDDGYVTAYTRGDGCPVNVSAAAMEIHAAIRTYLKQLRKQKEK